MVPCCERMYMDTVSIVDDASYTAMARLSCLYGDEFLEGPIVTRRSIP